AVLAGCTSTAGGDSNETTTNGADSDIMPATEAGIIGGDDAAGEPVNGGTLTFSGYSLPPALDPSDKRAQASGSTGGTPEINIYGALMRYDRDKDDYVPQMAKSLKVNDDHMTWTLTLRDGVTFSDGTPYDAQAVVDSINRYSQAHGPTSRVFTESVDSVEATAPDTVVFHMKHPWNELPAVLSYGYGMIIAPAGYADPDNFQPIGAGPFTVSDYAPCTSLTLDANPDYWDGEPHLDSLEFTSLEGGQTRVQALESGDIDMTFLRNPE